MTVTIVCLCDACKLLLLIYESINKNWVNVKQCSYMERGSSVVECRTRNQVSPGSNPPLPPFRRLGIFVLSIDTSVDSAV